MTKNIIDTNLIIRFLVNDDPQKASGVEQLLKDKSSKNVLLDTVVAEIIWVLSSYYSLDKKEIIEKIMSLIHVDTIECNAFLINRSLVVWEENSISYIDAYITSFAELGNMTIYSYDRRLSKIPNIIVKEPLTPKP